MAADITTRSGQRLTRFSLLVGAAAALVGIVYGYDQGSIAGALLFLRPDFGLSPFLVSVVVTGVPVGTFFGALGGGWIANAIGRKRSMLLIALGYTVFSGLQGVSTGPWMLAAFRFLLGLVVGVSIVAAPQFIAESVPPHVRGGMLVTFQTATNLGVMASYYVGLGLASLQSWRLILALAAVPGFIAAVVLWRLPDTARWYLMRGRRAEAERLLARVEPGQDPAAQADQIEEDLRVVGSGSYRQLLRPPLSKAGVFVIGLGFLVQITGINAITYYSPTILQSLGFASPTQALLATALVAIPGFLAVVTASLLVDRWGRRPTLLSGITTMTVANALLLLAYMGAPSKLLSVLGLVLFLIGFNFGYGALVWTYSSESLPAQMRAVGGSALLTADLFGNVLIGFFFPNVIVAIGGVGTFAILLALSVLAFGFVFMLAPETRGRPLESIRVYWENGGRWP